MQVVTSKVHPCGAVKSLTPQENGVFIEAENLNVRVLARNNRVLRITYSYAPAFNDFSYAVADPNLATGQLAITESEEGYLLATPELQLVLTRADTRMTVFDRQRRLLGQDEPGLGVSQIGSQLTAYRTLMPGEHFVGLGEKGGPLDRRGKAFTMWNTDAFGYENDTDPLYCSIPFYIGVHGGVVYGIFLDNSHRTNFNFGASNNRFCSFTTTGGDLNYYLITGDTVSDLVKEYTDLTGRMPMPPKWTLGLQQCRYSYYPDWRVLQLAENYRNRHIPCDVLYLDIHYMDNYKLFTWHPERFPNPAEFLGKLKERGFRVVTIIDPGIKTEGGYRAYEEGLKDDVFLKYPDGEPYTAQVWPGWCHFPDFSKPEARAWWARQFDQYVAQGISGFWTDMNEIASWGQSTPDNLIFNLEGHGTTHYEARNIYGMQMARATLEGTQNLMDNKRSFVLTRAGYAGVQRYAAVWTGDNSAHSGHMKLGVRLVLNMGLSGVAFAGVDIGGFIGEASKDLFARWVSLGAFSPLFRIHKMIDERESDPWSYGERVEAICRNYINLRYRLLPQLYCLFHEAATTGIPVVRPMAIYHPHDERSYWEVFEHQYYYGQNVLVAPCTEHDRYTKVWLPGEGEWYEFFTDRLLAASQEYLVESPIDKLPVFVKAGTFIFTENVKQHTGETGDGILQLHLYKGYQPFEMTWYEDDGESLDYQQGATLQRAVSHQPALHRLYWSAAQGEYTSAYQQLQVFFHGFDHLTAVRCNGKEYEIKLVSLPLLQPTPQFDPLGMSSLGYSVSVCTVTVPLTADAFHLDY